MFYTKLVFVIAKKWQIRALSQKSNLAGLCDQDRGNIVFAMANKQTWLLEHELDGPCA